MRLFKIYAIMSGLLAAMTISSCESALDMAPDGYVSLDEIFRDNDKTGAYLNSCYEYIPEMGCRFYYLSRGITVWSDEAWDVAADNDQDLIAGRLYHGIASAVYHPILDRSEEGGNGRYWDRYWAGVRKCAVFLSYIDKANVAQAFDRMRWKAEAYVLRAYYYSELLRWFGTGLPIIREAYGLDADFGKVKRASYYDTVKFVLEDCDAALEITELPWRITTDAEAGRVTRALAEAIKARMIVYAASPLYNEGQDHWEEAYQITKKSFQNLKANGYELYNRINYPAVYAQPTAHFPNDQAAYFNEYFTQNMVYSSNPADRETIYANRSDQGLLYDFDGIGINGMKSGTCPTQELVDAFETTDGEPVLDLKNPYIDAETHLQPNYNDASIYDPANPYENRDPRFYATVYYNGSQRTCFWAVNEDPACHENYPAERGYRTRIIATYPEEPYTGISADNTHGTRTGYYERKFLHPNAGADNGIKGAYVKMFRLGEVILNYAEAAAEAGHLDEARAALKELRARVGMPELPADIGQEELILRVRNERRVELALEGFRYFDVRRWTSPDGNLSKTDRWLTGMAAKRVEGPGGEVSYTYTRRALRERLCYQNRFLWVPIPAREANNMEAITGDKWQNPGW